MYNFQYPSNYECEGSILILDISSPFKLHMAAYFVFLTCGKLFLLFGLVEEPRYRRLTLVESYSYLAIDD